MSEPAKIYSLEQARERAELAIAQVDEHAHEMWKDEAKWAVAYVAKRHQEFIFDRVWDTLREFCPTVHTHEHRAMGPIVRWAVKEGLIAKTGRTAPGRRNAANATDMPVYRSLIYQG